MRDTFSTYHPAINFFYFASVILFGMFFMHPVCLAVSLVSAMTYSIWLKGKKAVKFNFLYIIPVMLTIAVANPVFNHEGATILLYINDNPLTLESILYGAAAAVMFASVIIWFSCYNEVMTSDKFIYLFGRVIPALSLIFSMVLRFVPKLKAQIKVISHAQKCVGRDVSNGNVLQRARNGIKIVSILTTWSLENAIETADSMRSRGYGLKGRTSFSLYRFDRRDRLVLAVMGALFLIVCAGALLGESNIRYFPTASMAQITPLRVMYYTAYAALCLLPLTLDIGEEIKWRKLRPMNWST